MDGYVVSDSSSEEVMFSSEITTPQMSSTEHDGGSPVLLHQKKRLQEGGSSSMSFSPLTDKKKKPRDNNIYNQAMTQDEQPRSSSNSQSSVGAVSVSNASSHSYGELINSKILQHSEVASNLLAPQGNLDRLTKDSEGGGLPPPPPPPPPPRSAETPRATPRSTRPGAESITTIESGYNELIRSKVMQDGRVPHDYLQPDNDHDVIETTQGMTETPGGTSEDSEEPGRVRHSGLAVRGGDHQENTNEEPTPPQDSSSSTAVPEAERLPGNSDVQTPVRQGSGNSNSRMSPMERAGSTDSNNSLPPPPPPPPPMSNSPRSSGRRRNNSNRSNNSGGSGDSRTTRSSPMPSMSFRRSRTRAPSPSTTPPAPPATVSRSTTLSAAIDSLLGRGRPQTPASRRSLAQSFRATRAASPPTAAAARGTTLSTLEQMVQRRGRRSRTQQQHGASMASSATLQGAAVAEAAAEPPSPAPPSAEEDAARASGADIRPPASVPGASAVSSLESMMMSRNTKRRHYRPGTAGDDTASVASGSVAGAHAIAPTSTHTVDEPQQRLEDLLTPEEMAFIQNLTSAASAASAQPARPTEPLTSTSQTSGASQGQQSGESDLESHPAVDDAGAAELSSQHAMAALPEEQKEEEPDTANNLDNVRDILLHQASTSSLNAEELAEMRHTQSMAITSATNSSHHSALTSSTTHSELSKPGAAAASASMTAEELKLMRYSSESGAAAVKPLTSMSPEELKLLRYSTGSGAGRTGPTPAQVGAVRVNPATLSSHSTPSLSPDEIKLMEQGDLRKSKKPKPGNDIVGDLNYASVSSLNAEDLAQELIFQQSMAASIVRASTGHHRASGAPLGERSNHNNSQVSFFQDDEEDATVEGEDLARLVMTQSAACHHAATSAAADSEDDVEPLPPSSVIRASTGASMVSALTQTESLFSTPSSSFKPGEDYKHDERPTGVLGLAEPSGEPSSAGDEAKTIQPAQSQPSEQRPVTTTLDPRRPTRTAGESNIEEQRRPRRGRRNQRNDSASSLLYDRAAAKSREFESKEFELPKSTREFGIEKSKSQDFMFTSKEFSKEFSKDLSKDLESTKSLMLPVAAMVDDRGDAPQQALELLPDELDELERQKNHRWFHRSPRRRRIYLATGFLLFVLVIVAVAAALTAIFWWPAPTDDSATESRQVAIEYKVQALVGNDVLQQTNTRAVQSPYRRALQWIIQEDPHQLSSDHGNMLQRFVLAYFYFATTTAWKQPTFDSDGVSLLSNENNNVTATEAGIWMSCNYAPGLKVPDCIKNRLENVLPPIYRRDLPTLRWLSNSSECGWSGISCENGHVVGIELDGQLLSGAFPDGIFRLPYLQSVSLKLCHLTGPLPTTFSLAGSKKNSMHHLTVLELSMNQFTGQLPTELLTLPKLTHVNFAHNHLSGSIPTDVGSLLDAKQFRLYENQLTGSLPSHIGLMNSVDTVFWHKNRLSGELPTSIKHWRSISSLTLHHNRFSGSIPAEIQEFQKTLVWLELQNNNFTGTLPKELYSLLALEELDLSHNQLSGSLSPKIGSLDNLQFLTLTGNQMTGSLPSELSQFERLYSIAVDDNNFVGSMPTEFCATKRRTLHKVVADCGGDPPQVACDITCCTECCHEGSCLPTTAKDDDEFD